MVDRYYYFGARVRFGNKVFDLVFDTEKNKTDSATKPQTVHLYSLNEKGNLTEQGANTLASKGSLVAFDKNVSQNAENVKGKKTWWQSAFSGSRVDYDRPSLEAIGSGEGNQRIAPPRGAYVNRVLYLFENADASTFMHETAHWFFEELGKIDTAKTNEMRAKIDEWANNEFDKRYKVIETENGFAVADKTGNIVYGEDQAFNTLEQARDYAKNELFARGFEQYLRDGKAPNNYLKEAFRSFLNWLRRLYNAATELNVDLNDDIRNVFGQILGGENLDFYLEAPVDEILQHNFEMNKDRQKANDDIISDALNNMSADTYSDVWKYELHDLKKAAQSTKRIYKEKREMVKKAGGDLIDKIITPIDTRLNRINPKLKNRMVNYEARLGIKLNNYYRQIKPFMDIWKTFSRADLTAFDLAKNNGVKGSGFGMVKFIFKHGEESSDTVKISKNDVVSFPEIVRKYEPLPDTGHGTNRTWSIKNKDGQQIVYSDTVFAEDGKRHLVTIHAITDDKSNIKGIFSEKRRREAKPAHTKDTTQKTFYRTNESSAEASAPKSRFQGGGDVMDNIISPDELKVKDFGNYDAAAFEKELNDLPDLTPEEKKANADIVKKIKQEDDWDDQILDCIVEFSKK